MQRFLLLIISISTSKYCTVIFTSDVHSDIIQLRVVSEEERPLLERYPGCEMLQLGVSQVGGGLSVLLLPGLSHSHVDALQPLLGVLLILSFQHVRLAVCKDFKGPWKTPIPAFFSYDLQTKTNRG